MIPQLTAPDLAVIHVRRRRQSADAEDVAAAIVEEVRSGGADALRALGIRFGDIDTDEPLMMTGQDMTAALARIPLEERAALQRAAERIERFAQAQRTTFTDLTFAVPGGTAGHRWIPVDSVGAYAPGGRYPLPSSVLMTVIPARVAGVRTVWVASPRPTDTVLAAAAIAGADALIPIGGAQAIAALAFGTVGPRCDVVVGPGNRWVTAAKRYLYGEIGIDGLAGPSEILVIADGNADPDLVAADLLAQAEHDPDAVPMLITLTADMRDAVIRSIDMQLTDLPTAPIARPALDNGFSLIVDSIVDAVAISNEIAPEHLALHVDDADKILPDLTSYGSAFVGDSSAEAFADYGAGPNHVLPTAGGARYQSGLSVSTYLRSPTWLRLDNPKALIDDTVLLAGIEGLVGHAQAASRRSS
ncbi:MAG: histidinol dehydrogenase [Acidimicrobiia bacterium]|nr:histidinol dehydrogenase [Acidimicrobiia bacterium]